MKQARLTFRGKDRVATPYYGEARPTDHVSCDDDILPVFCPTSQMDFVKSKKGNADKPPATLHGVVFEILLSGRERLGPDPDLVTLQVA
ncbi:hypothetical protein AYJ54_46410 [Bradyrhizobium centrolobii]|uniref:Uncharacterized protein n=1 Tax=Bradyrhizobium centrolobii TaxID=1505087 RepID=A0A176Z0R5_9BRAD|nr:hypothetical protein [Bradyrhizobium centrolobii]OAF12685.1 hypothetical protein AYJ54_46410 [Bradyrhizobium centrolobii]